MPPILEQLALIQEKDGRLLALKTEFRELPNRKNREEERKRAAQGQLQAARDEQKKALAAIHQAEMDIQAAKEKTDRLRRQQFEIKSNDQYRVLQHEIEAEIAGIRLIEDRELEHMEKMETARDRVARMERETEALLREVGEQGAALEERSRTIEEEMARVEAERQSLMSGVDANWLNRYNRLLAHIGPPVIVPIVRDTCGGCHMRLSPHVIQDAKRRLDICSCTYCGRMLYWDG